MITQLSSSCTAVRSVQSQRCTHMIYHNKYSVDFYLPCFSFVTTSELFYQIQNSVPGDLGLWCVQPPSLVHGSRSRHQPDINYDFIVKDFLKSELRQINQTSAKFFLIILLWQADSVPPLVGRVDTEILSPNPLIIPGQVTNPQSRKVYTNHILAGMKHETKPENGSSKDNIFALYILATSYDGKLRRSSSMNLPRHLYGGGGGGAFLGARLRQLRQKREEEFHIKKAVIPIPRLG